MRLRRGQQCAWILQKKKSRKTWTCPQNVVGGGTFSSCLFQIRLLFLEQIFVVICSEFVAFDGVIFDGSEVQLHLRTMDYWWCIKHRSCATLLWFSLRWSHQVTVEILLPSPTLRKIGEAFLTTPTNQQSGGGHFSAAKPLKIVTEVCKFWESVCLPGKKSQFVQWFHLKSPLSSIFSGVPARSPGCMSWNLVHESCFKSKMHHVFLGRWTLWQEYLFGLTHPDNKATLAKCHVRSIGPAAIQGRGAMICTWKQWKKNGSFGLCKNKGLSSDYHTISYYPV